MTGSVYYHITEYDNILRLLASGLHPERMVTHRFPLADGPISTPPRA